MNQKSFFVFSTKLWSIEKMNQKS